MTEVVDLRTLLEPIICVWTDMTDMCINMF